VTDILVVMTDQQRAELRRGEDCQALPCGNFPVVMGRDGSSLVEIKNHLKVEHGKTDIHSGK